MQINQPYGIVYMAKDRFNNKIYIGATRKSLTERSKMHFASAKADSGASFHTAIRLYGNDNFDWSILAFCENDADLRRTEEDFIRKTNACAFGYNIKIGGYGKRPKPLSVDFERITFDAPKNLAVLIRSLAKKEGISMADIIRRNLKQSLETPKAVKNA